jgi:hypothetical protein
MEIAEGDMVRADGRTMKVGSIDNDIATCVWFDGRGTLDCSDYLIDALTTMTESLRPRSIWAETRQISDDDLIKMESDDASRRKMRRIKRLSARKARASKRIKQKASDED